MKRKRFEKYTSQRKLQQNLVNSKCIKKPRKREEVEPDSEESTCSRGSPSDDVNWDDQNDVNYYTDDEEELRNDFGRNDAVNMIAGIFLYNNISRNLSFDIFQISKLLKEFSSINLTEIWKRMDSWCDHENRQYSSCLCCNQILATSKKCRNLNCDRYGKSQSNLAGNTQILTFSIRKQIKDLLETGDFNADIFDRRCYESSLTARLSRTPKYLERLKRAESLHPDVTTIFATINIDGFRRRGLARGEFWPLFVAINDLSDARNCFKEYRPELVMLSSMIFSSQTLGAQDFQSAFERFRLDLLDIQENPIEISVNGNVRKVRLELFQTVIDMDASRKIHGLPKWQSYSSCSRCSIRGKQIATRKGQKIAWIVDGSEKDYDENNVPPKLKTTCLPPPWTEGYDSLHLIMEGTSKDVVKDLLSGTKKYGTKIRDTIRSQWAHALTTAKHPKSMASNHTMDPIQLSSRTGSEIQQLFNVAVPTLIVCHEDGELWMFCLYFQWIVTRLVMNKHLSISHCQFLQEAAPLLQKLLADNFPQFCTMKQHFVLDHLVPNIHLTGSPLLSSAAPFERLNMVLGRGMNTHTTRTVSNMACRFVGLQKAVYTCSASTGKAKCQVSFPRSMKSQDEETPSSETKEDLSQLTSQEELFGLSKGINMSNRRSTTIANGRLLTTRRYCDEKTQKNCYVYLKESNEEMVFGCIERIFDIAGNEGALIQKFIVVSSFDILEKWASPNPFYRNLLRKCEKFNYFFKKVIGIEYSFVSTSQILGYCSVFEFNSNSFVSLC